MDALVAVDRRTGAGLALEMEDLGAVGKGGDDGLGLGLAALDVVGADMGEDAFDPVDPAVDGHHRDAGLDRLLDGGASALTSSGEMTMALRPAPARPRVGGLLGRGVLAVVSIRVTPSASASTLIWLSMCTKKGT